MPGGEGALGFEPPGLDVTGLNETGAPGSKIKLRVGSLSPKLLSVRVKIIASNFPS